MLSSYWYKASGHLNATAIYLFILSFIHLCHLMSENKPVQAMSEQ